MQYPGAGPRKDATGRPPRDRGFPGSPASSGACRAARRCAMLARLMPLLTLADAELAFGAHPLLDRAAFSRRAGERIGLIGRNGTGKSSLLGSSPARLPLDDGELRRRDGLRIASSEQEPALPAAADAAREPRARGRPRRDRTTSARAGASRRGSSSTCTASGWTRRCGPRPPPAASASAPRSRWRSRSSPQLLLLDEPTNHLDIDGIERLEELLLRRQHDRHRRHPRPLLPRLGRDAHRRARPRPAAFVPRQLRRLRASQGRAAGRGSRRATGASTSSGRRKRSGSARASRPGARATKAA